MSRLLRDATATNARNQQQATAASTTNSKQPPPVTKLDIFDDFPKNPPSPVPNKQQAFTDIPRPLLRETEEGNSELLDLKTFAKDFLANGAASLGLNINHSIPEDINSFVECDKFVQNTLPDLKLELRIEAERVNHELAKALIDLRNIEHQTETAVALDKEKAVVVSLLYDRRDLQTKTAILTDKKSHVLSCQELLSEFETFAELSRDMYSFQRVANGYANEQKMYFPESDLEPELQLSLAYSQLHMATKGFVLDKDPLHDYHIVELPGEDWISVRAYIEQEYRLFRSRQGK